MVLSLRPAAIGGRAVANTVIGDSADADAAIADCQALPKHCKSFLKHCETLAKHHRTLNSPKTALAISELTAAI